MTQNIKLRSGSSWLNLTPIYGVGFPQGVVTAPTGSIYIDTAVTNGASSWIKKSGTGSTGWQVLEGDTGWRNITALLINGWAVTVSIQIRRINSQVFIKVEGLNATARTLDRMLVLPDGFLYGIGSAPRFLLHSAATPAVAYRGYLDGAINISNSTTSMPLTYGQIDYSTTLTWPTTLPGVSV